VPVRETFGKKPKVEQREISKVLITVAPDRWGHMTARLGERLKKVLQLSGFIFNAVHVFDLDKLGQQIRNVFDRVRIAKIQLAHTSFSQLTKECPNRTIFCNPATPFLAHSHLLCEWCRCNKM